jgi:hypothetical protein
MKVIALSQGVLAVLVAISSVANAQEQGKEIQKKLEAEYKLTKTNYDKTDIVTAGSVIVLQKDKVLMLAASSANPCRNTYKDGQIKQSGPCAANEKLKRFSALTSRIPGKSNVPDSPSSHTFVTGEKFWVTKIEVRDAGKDPGIVFSFFTDEIGDDKTRYATTLLIPFGAITPTPDQALKVAQEVITVAPAEDAKADAKSDQPAPAQSAQKQPAAPAAPAAAAAAPPAEAAPAPIEAPPPPPADPAPTPTVSLGQSTDEVVAIMGQPLKKAQIGTKTIYTYKDLKITFVNGKVKDVQ